MSILIKKKAWRLVGHDIINTCKNRESLWGPPITSPKCVPNNCGKGEDKLGLSCAKLRANLKLAVWYFWFDMFGLVGWVF